MIKTLGLSALLLLSFTGASRADSASAYCHKEIDRYNLAELVKKHCRFILDDNDLWADAISCKKDHRMSDDIFTSLGVSKMVDYDQYIDEHGIVKFCSGMRDVFTRVDRFRGIYGDVDRQYEDEVRRNLH